MDKQTVQRLNDMGDETEAIRYALSALRQEIIDMKNQHNANHLQHIAEIRDLNAQLVHTQQSMGQVIVSHAKMTDVISKELYNTRLNVSDTQQRMHRFMGQQLHMMAQMWHRSPNPPHYTDEMQEANLQLNKCTVADSA